jgi:predicted esterase
MRRSFIERLGGFGSDLLYKVYSPAIGLFAFKQYGSVTLKLFLLFTLTMQLGCQGEFKAKKFSRSLSGPGDLENDDDNGGGGDDGGGGPDPSQFHTRGSGGPTGAANLSYDGRSYRVYVPPNYNPNSAAKVIVAFYGLGDDFENFWDVFTRVEGVNWRAIADQEGAIIVVPATKNPNRRSFLHITPQNQFDESGTLAEANGVLNLIYYGVGQLYNLDTKEIYFMGFSEGATFASFTGVNLSKQVKAIVAYGGSLNPYRESLIERDVPFFFLTGTQDSAYNFAMQASQDWIDRGNIVRTEFPVGIPHSMLQLDTRISETVIWNWLQSINIPEVRPTYQRP